MGPVRTLLPCGKRLHVQHGPIDLIIGADGNRDRAFDAASARFQTVLEELVAELPQLRHPQSSLWRHPNGETARRMDRAARRFAESGYLTRMAAVAGAVADTVLQAMIDQAAPRRAYVNNGGDIALHLGQGAHFTTAIQSHDGQALGQIVIRDTDPIRGIATSGRHGRSLSLGIADSVTVLAQTAAQADVAATLIANAVDLPGHPCVTRVPAHKIHDDSDLGAIPVVTACDALSLADKTTALTNGANRALAYLADGRIAGAAMVLQGEARSTGAAHIQRILEHA